MNPWYTQLTAAWMNENHGVDIDPVLMPDGSMRYYVTDKGVGILSAMSYELQRALKTVGAWPIEGEA